MLLQKGNTKLALYGMSNVRDERLYRTFRDGKVKFFRPGTQKQDWFNLMSVHQNQWVHSSKQEVILIVTSYEHTGTDWLPEDFLPDFLDMVIWGHEHECLIDPKFNPGKNFYVMQPGSSVATSLMPGEAVPKHVAVMSITGRDFTVKTIPLKTVRPFIMREIVLGEEKAAMRLAKKASNRTELTQFLTGIVDEMIKQANREWEESRGEDSRDEDEKPPKPLIRLRVEYTAPEGGNFDCENPQRFSNRFVDKVANKNDVVQFYRKKAGATRRSKGDADMPEESALASLALDSIKIDQLVKEFLSAQSLTILPQNSFGDAVGQFVDKDDKHAMEVFVTENLTKQVESLMKMDHVDEDSIREAMEEGKSHLEELFASGRIKRLTNAKIKPKPDGWDSELEGEWAAQPMARYFSADEDEENSDDAVAQPAAKAPAKGRGKAAAPKKAAAPAKKAAPAKNSRSKKKVVESESEEEDEDVVMVDSDEYDSQQLFVKPAPPTRGKKAAPVKETRTKAPARGVASQTAKQSQLSFSQPTRRAPAKTTAVEVEDDISDDDDAFEPAPSARPARSRR